MALLPNQSRCSFHSLPGAISRYADQHLQDLIPPRALAARWQAISPKAIQLQRLPQLPGQPTGAPLPRPA